MAVSSPPLHGATAGHFGEPWITIVVAPQPRVLILHGAHDREPNAEPNGARALG